MATCQSSETSTPAPKASKKAAAPLTSAEGIGLYTRVCASCHGTKGHGDGHRSRMIGPLPDFTTAEFHKTRSDDQLRAMIMEGKGSMPAFKARFGEHEITALIAVVRTFAPPP